MTVTYDKHYQTENLFGEAYPELLQFFANYPDRGKLLDLGCGQGRDAIPLARLGYTVTGIDHSKVGITQMNKAAQAEHLDLSGEVGDIYNYDRFGSFDFILLDSMFHFGKKERANETSLLQRIITQARPGTIIAFCIPATGKIVEILCKTIDSGGKLERMAEQDFIYEFRQGSHSSNTAYKLIIVRK